MNKKTSVIQIHCEGTNAQYWALKLMLNGSLHAVHTSKTYSYVLEIQRNWMKPSFPIVTSGSRWG